MLRKFWLRISELGSDFYTDPSYRRLHLTANRTVLLFIFILSYVFFFCIYIAVNATEAEWQQYGDAIVFPILNLTIITLLSASYWLGNRVQTFRLRRYFVVFSFLCGVLYIGIDSLLLGPSSGFMMYLFVLIPIPYFLLHRTEKGLLLFCELFLFFVFLALLIHAHTGGKALVKLPEAIYDYLYYQVHIFLFIGISLTSYFLYSQTARTESSLIQLSSTDELTRILNRRRFTEQAEKTMRHSHITGESVSLVLFDIDFFKRINDTYGHQKGDMVLKTLCDLVADNIRPSDSFARWGGEEFILLLHSTGQAGAKAVAYKLKRVIADYDFGLRRKVTASFGITTLRFNDSLEDAVGRADKALYDAKRQGRNRIARAANGGNKMEIRQGKESDLAVIAALIRELAVFEKLESMLDLSIERMDEHFFGDDPKVFLAVATEAGKEGDEIIAGYVIYFYTYSTFLSRHGIYIEDLFVLENHRGEGIGKALLDYTVELGREKGFGRIEWSALKWNPACKFYDNYGGQALDEWVMYRYKL